MVRARLHLICGNCGCSDDWEWEFKKDHRDLTDTEPEFADDVALSCGNCSTLHFVSEYAEERKKRSPTTKPISLKMAEEVAQADRLSKAILILQKAEIILQFSMEQTRKSRKKLLEDIQSYLKE